MIQLVKVSELLLLDTLVASKLAKSKLWKLAEELSISGKELNKLAKEVVGREFGDCGRLTEGENRKVRQYLEKNRRVLGERYRKMVWNTKYD